MVDLKIHGNFQDVLEISLIPMYEDKSIITVTIKNPNLHMTFVNAITKEDIEDIRDLCNKILET